MRLRTRLLLSTVVVATFALLASGVLTFVAFRSFLYERLDDALRQAALPLTPDEGDEQGPGRAGPVQPAFVQLRSADGTVIRTIEPEDGSGRTWTPALPQTIQTPGTTLRADGPATFLTVPSVEPDGPDFRVKASTNPAGEQLIIALPTTETEDLLRRLALLEFTVALVALATAGAVGLLLVRRDLAPLERLTAAVRAIDVDDRPDGVRVEDPRTEVGELAGATNTLLAEIEVAFAARDATEERLRQFVADASHELRTPVTAISAYAQLFTLGAEHRPDDLRRSMAGIERETERMRVLIDDLVVLARLDHAAPPVAGTVDVAAVATEAVETARRVGPDWPVDLVVAGQPRAHLPGSHLRQILDNLLGNVRAHTPAGTTTHVRVACEGGAVTITVEDGGPGVPGDDKQHMFERFWRADAARSRATGGSGLGLSIAAAMVQAAGGTIVASDTPGGGLTVTVTLPATALPTTAPPTTAPPTTAPPTTGPPTAGHP